MKKIVFVLGLLLFLGLAVPIQAAPKKVGKNPSAGITLSKNKLSVIINFANLTNVKSFKYTLTYDSTKGAQGVSGTVKPKGATLARTLLLGTCSKKVCVYHKGVKNIKLNVDFTLKNGGSISYTKKI
ncbi:hypothetical protein HY404_02810 [Candidatus Microgenomates bacterium]|nr:hypothetical protein [Candidatus Microgenomates bacterium]